MFAAVGLYMLGTQERVSKQPCKQVIRVRATKPGRVAQSVGRLTRKSEDNMYS